MPRPSMVRARKLVVNRPAKQKGHKLNSFEKRDHRSFSYVFVICSLCGI